MQFSIALKIVLLIITYFILVSWIDISLQNPKPSGQWKAPPTADNLKNPLKNDLGAAASGQVLYSKQCAICHGETGVGNGPGGANLNPKPADHTSAQIQSLSDGALFWMITNGRGSMPAYNQKLTETQRWQLVNYIRTLRKK